MEFSDVTNDLSEILFEPEDLSRIVKRMARQIDEDYAGEKLLLVGVLKGAAPFMVDLARELSIHAELDWMAVSSYGNSTHSSGVVRILKDLDAEIADRHVLIAEDLIDSGLTLSWLKENLLTRNPASVEIAALLRKPEAMKRDPGAKYIGEDISNSFVVGYGLDYAEKYRNLKGIAVLAPHVYS